MLRLLQYHYNPDSKPVYYEANYADQTVVLGIDKKLYKMIKEEEEFKQMLKNAKNLKPGREPIIIPRSEFENSFDDIQEKIKYR